MANESSSIKRLACLATYLTLWLEIQCLGKKKIDGGPGLQNLSIFQEQTHTTACDNKGRRSSKRYFLFVEALVEPDELSNQK